MAGNWEQDLDVNLDSQSSGATIKAKGKRVDDSQSTGARMSFNEGQDYISAHQRASQYKEQGKRVDDSQSTGVRKTVDINPGSRLGESIKEALLNLQLTWEIIENVSEISSTVSVNKFQCERIADHFRQVAKSLEDLGLDKGFAGCQVLDDGLMRFSITFKFDLFFKARPLLLALLSSFTHGAEHRKLNFLVQHEDTAVSELVAFIGEILKKLIEGRDLVLIHKGLKDVNTEIVDKTGLYGERFAQLHRELDEPLMRLSNWPRTPYPVEPDYDSTLISYLNSNCLGSSEHLFITFNTSRDDELANALAKMLERPDSVLKGLTFSWPETEDMMSYIELEREETMSDRLVLESEKIISDVPRLTAEERIREERRSKCRSTVIEALSRSTKLVRFRIEAATESDIHELCSSLAANKILEELDLEFPKYSDAETLFAMLKMNQSVKILRLLYPAEGHAKIAESLGAMLTENSTLEELVVSGDFFNEIQQLIWPLIANDDGESPVNTSLRRLTIDGFEISILAEVSAVARMLRTNKSLLYFSMCYTDVEPAEGCEILKSLEDNKTLQELRINNWFGFEIAVFMDLLVKHNFTLKTIWFRFESFSAEDFIEFVLKPLKIRGEIFSDWTTWNDVDNLQQDRDPKTSGGPAIENRGSSFESIVTRYQMEPTIESIRSSSNSVPNYDIFLSYSEDGKDFAKQLYMNLKASNYNVLNDPNSSNIAKEESFATSISEATEQCQLAVIVLSEGYLTSKQSMLELSRYMKRKNSSDPTLKVFPLFYKLTLSDLDAKKVEVEWAETWKLLIQDGKVQEEEIGLWNEAVKVIFDEKNAELERAKALLKDLIQGTIKAEEFCTLFSGACDDLDFKNYHNSEVEYLSAIVEKIKNIIPPMKKCNNDQMLGYVSMFEMQSELSLQKMTSLLEKEPLLEDQFLLQRALNKGQFLRQKYIEWNTFKAMDTQYGKGCITAALFPKAFLYHFKAQVLSGALNKVSNFHDSSCLPILMDAAIEVAKKWKAVYGHEHQPIYMDIEDSIDVEQCELSHGGIIAICKNFHEGEEVGKNLQTGIVEDNLTGVYCCGRVNSSTLGGSIHSEATGVLGVTWKCSGDSPDIYVEDMWEDGSYYDGTLKDFSYEFDKEKDDYLHKQCATKAFGDLQGAHFLKNGYGIKCSPLFIIALANATQSKGLKLTLDDKSGHMQIDSKFSELESRGSYQCQILFTDKIKHLGVVVEWGMDQMEVDSYNRDIHGDHSLQYVERPVDKRKWKMVDDSQSSGATIKAKGKRVDDSQSTGATLTSIEAQDCSSTYQAASQDKKEGKIVDDSESTGGTINSNNAQDYISAYQSASQDKKKGNFEVKGAGSGVGFGWEIQNPRAKSITKISRRKIHEDLWRREGGFVEKIVIDEKHGPIKEKLTQCTLHAASLNYLVVYDNVKESHVSIYTVQERGLEGIELDWNTDIFLEGGREQRDEIFKKGLKGRNLAIKRHGTDYTIGLPGKPTGYFLLLANKVTGRSKLCNVKDKLIELPEFGEAGSNDEWQHIIGEQENFTGEKKFWWEASFMQAIICSRTRFSSGYLLTTTTSVEGQEHHRIGHCSRNFSNDNDNDRSFVHHCCEVETRGKFSKALATQASSIMINWGGLSPNAQL